MDFWTIERIDRLKAGVANGESFGTIANEIGCSRGAAIGKYHRLRAAEFKLKGESPSTRAHRDTVHKRDYKPSRTMPAVSRVGVGFIMPPLPLLEPRQGPAVGIIEATGCKWPVAEDASLIGGHECCNGTRVTGSSYCAHHKAKAKSPTFVKSWMDRAA